MGAGSWPRSEILRSAVSRIWSYESHARPGVESLGATVRGQLLINLDTDELCHRRVGGIAEQVEGIAFHGMLTRPVLIRKEHKRRICGVQFTPGGLARFVHASATLFTDRLVGACAVWDDAAELRETLTTVDTPDQLERMIETFLQGKLQSEPPGWAKVQHAAGLLEQGATVTQVRHTLDYSQRSLHAGFDAYVGSRPKTFARIARAHRARDTARERSSWSAHAADHGYSDQAHMVRDWARFSGATPSTYLPVDSEEPHHGATSEQF